MKSCPQCGMKNTDEAAFCRGCGSRLAASESAAETPVVQAEAYAPVAAPATPVAKTPIAPPREAVDAQLSAQLGRSSRTLWGALAVVALIIIGGLVV